MIFLLLVLAAVAAARNEEKTVQFQTMGDRGTYDFGYDTGLHGAHSLRRESKDENGIVRGKYSYTDPNGKLRTVNYEAGPFGFRAKGDVGPDGYPQGEVGIPVISIDANGTVIGDSNDYVADASSHPNRETKGYVYDPASHPSVHNRLFIPNPPPPPPPPAVHIIHDEASHPNSRSKGYVHNVISPPVHRPAPPPVSRPLPPVVRVPDASSHPNSRSKGYVHDIPSPHVILPPPSRIVEPPVVRIPDASSHPNSKSKGYVHNVPHPPPPPRPPVAPPVVHVHDASSHPNSRSKGYVHTIPSPPVHPAPPAPVHVHEASSHPNSRSKGYVHDTSQQSLHVHSSFVHKPGRVHVHQPAYVPPIPPRKDVVHHTKPEIISVSRQSSVSITRTSDRSKGYVGSRPQATIHRPISRPTYTKGYVTGSRSQVVSRPSYVKPRPAPPVHVHQASSHPNIRSKGYVHSASSHPVAPPATVHVHDASSHPNSRSKGYVHDPSIPIPSSHFHVSESKVETSRIKSNHDVPYMSAEEYITRYRSGGKSS